MRVEGWTFRRALLRHVLAAALATAPSTLLVYGIIQWARGATAPGGLGGLLLDLTVLYPGVAAFVAAGAVLLTAALAAVRRIAGGATRVTVLLLSPLLLLPWILLPARALLTWPPALGGVAAGLLVFTALADPGGPAPVRQAAV